MLLTILVFLVILSVLVLIHEAGHFFVAKKLGIKVEEFGFGFPPRVFGIKRGETLYSINLLPIGGFVKLYGEDDAGGGKVQVKTQSAKLKTEDERRAFYARPVWQKIAVVIAGVLMNFLLAIVLLSYLFTQGIVTPSGHVIVEQVLPNSPAAAAHIQKGDIIKSINGREVTTTMQLQKNVYPNIEKEVNIIIVRGEKKQQVTLKTKKQEVNGKQVGIIGVALKDSVLKKYPFYQAPFYATGYAFELGWQMIATLPTIAPDLVNVTKAPQGVAGPVGIAQLTGAAVRVGPEAVIYIMSILSLTLAVFNVLPIPALDGGRLFFIVLSGVTGKKVDPKIEGIIHNVGLVLLLALMLKITFFDISRLIGGQSLFQMP